MTPQQALQASIDTLTSALAELNGAQVPTQAPAQTPAPTQVPTQPPAQTAPGVWTRGNIAHAINFDADTGHNYRMTIGSGQTLSIKFTTGDAGVSGNFMCADDPCGQFVNKFMHVSTVQGDFAYENYDAQNGFAASGQFVRVDYQVGSFAAPGVAILQPHTTYYINIRNEMVWSDSRSPAQRGVDSCPEGVISGFVFEMQKH